MKTITKKIKSKYFKDVISNKKTFELRKEDDVIFEVGDILTLNEIDESLTPTGRRASFTITYVLRDYEGIQEGFAIVGIKSLEQSKLSIPIEWINKYIEGAFEKWEEAQEIIVMCMVWLVMGGNKNE